MNEFSRLYTQYQGLTAMDVWTGRSNAVVNSWSTFCSVHAPALSAAVTNREGTSAEISELRSVISKFNTFSADLTTKIRTLQISEHAKQVLQSFPQEHDRLIAGFRQSLPDLDKAGGYYEAIAELEQNLKNLRIDDHPTVVSAFAGIKNSFSQMEDILQDLTRRLEEQPPPGYVEKQPVNPAPRGYIQQPAPPPLVEEFSLPPPSRTQSQPPQQQQPQVPKFCGECGAPTGGNRFCGECGKKFY